MSEWKIMPGLPLKPGEAPMDLVLANGERTVAYRPEDASRNSAYEELVLDLETKLAATEKELRIIHGQLKTVLNNWEQAKGKLKRKEAELNERKRVLDERDATTAEEMCAEQVGYWKKQAEKASAQAEEYREKLSKVLDLAEEMRRAGR